MVEGSNGHGNLKLRHLINSVFNGTQMTLMSLMITDCADMSYNRCFQCSISENLLHLRHLPACQRADRFGGQASGFEFQLRHGTSAPPTKWFYNKWGTVLVPTSVSVEFSFIHFLGTALVRR